MTSPYLVGRPARPEDLSAFYPEWAAPASGAEAEKRICRDRCAELARVRRRQARQALLRRMAGAWISLWGKTGLRGPMIGRAPVNG